MPQMMPINWILSFILFILIFILFNIMNYYIYISNKNKNYLKKFSINNFSWKW
uniref:ATP synthase F0 subunit 8 n=1 Tax=Capila pennicillatum TaxID=2866476 RepID=UPI002A836DFE|nr:ATP synthase F0 subunit 8 [Capila pennicillatum]WNO18744.1 ATP synthase F0 subunit 8 [Capila pennicillatum]